MDYKIKQLYRQVEMAHFDEPYNSLAKAISLVLEDDELDEWYKLSIINTYVKDYFEELNYTSESEYL